jgi:excinuclease ABC subunit B
MPDTRSQPFVLETDMTPAGDQPGTIAALCEALRGGARHSTILGVTGSGKTYTMAKIVEELQRPALVLAPNKTLAAQLYSEFKAFYPNNAIEYFVSYYDYYQPEAYVPTSDTYIEKEATINEAINRMRNSATRSLMERRDVMIIASISCIYGLGSPEHYRELSVQLRRGEERDRDSMLRAFASIQYRRNNYEFTPGTFRVRGDVVEIFPVYEQETAIRIEMFGDEIESIMRVDPLRGEVVQELDEISIFPSSHYVTPQDRLFAACDSIEAELEEHLQVLKKRGKLLEGQRLEQRTLHDLEMMRATGICNGIENYSRHLDGRIAGQPPATLIHYFPDDYILFIDESHVSVPQSGGMYRGDRSRKETLVEYGFRLPSAIDNRPLQFEEFVSLQNQVVYVSATPNDYEIEQSGPNVFELVVRPTGLVDPPVEIRPARGQVDDLVGTVRDVVGKGFRVLVTTLTKRSSEELTDYFVDLGIKVRYLHSDIDSLERAALIRDLRLGVFDCLVGINLLREGLDLPEVGLVAVLDADKEGFLRSRRSLIQTSGRAARNVEGRVIFYADKETDSIRESLAEMSRRRELQLAHNEKHGIEPKTIVKEIRDPLEVELHKGSDDQPRGRRAKRSTAPRETREPVSFGDRKTLVTHIAKLRAEMQEAAKNLDFETAAQMRDEVFRLEKMDMELR